MSHETLIYGCIVGSTYMPAEYRTLQIRNLEVIEQLPLEFDGYPGICRAMFSAPPQEAMRGGWESQVIHFGGSFKDIDSGYSELATWIEKFERLLATLYWLEAVIHLKTELMGELKFDYEPAEDISELYVSGTPTPTNKWTRRFFINQSEATFNS